MTVKLLTEHHLEFLISKGGCTGSSESTLVKMPHCWKSRVTAQMFFACTFYSLYGNCSEYGTVLSRSLLEPEVLM